jgi:hypothetical protein
MINLRFDRNILMKLGSIIFIVLLGTQVRAQKFFCIDDQFRKYYNDIDTIIHMNRIKREICKGEKNDTLRISINNHSLSDIFPSNFFINSDSSLYINDSITANLSNIYVISDSFFITTFLNSDCITFCDIYAINGDTLLLKYGITSSFPFVFLDKNSGSILSFSDVKYKNDIYSENDAYREIEIYNFEKQVQITKKIFLNKLTDKKYFNIDDYDIALDFYKLILEKYVQYH